MLTERPCPPRGSAISPAGSTENQMGINCSPTATSSLSASHRCALQNGNCSNATARPASKNRQHRRFAPQLETSQNLPTATTSNLQIPSTARPLPTARSRQLHPKAATVFCLTASSLTARPVKPLPKASRRKCTPPRLPLARISELLECSLLNRHPSRRPPASPQARPPKPKSLLKATRALPGQRSRLAAARLLPGPSS